MWPSTTVVHHLVMPRHAQSSGPFRTGCPSTGNRCIRRTGNWLRNTRPMKTANAFIGCRHVMGQYRRRIIPKDFPIIFTSGRLVEYEGGGEESRSNPWLAELQQDMFVEINPKDANDSGIKDEQMVWIETPEGRQDKSQGHGHPAGGARCCLYPISFWRSLSGTGPG